MTQIIAVLLALFTFFACAKSTEEPVPPVHDTSPRTSAEPSPPHKKRIMRHRWTHVSRSKHRHHVRFLPRYSPRHNWDGVAQCESGQNWRINTGNGFYGGLQFTRNTWLSFGGHGMPQYASKATQIQVAERILRGQGIGAWPNCGRYLTAR